MKSKSEITRYRNLMDKKGKGLERNFNERDKQLLEQIRNIFPFKSNEEQHQLKMILRDMDKYIEMVNTPPMSYEEYLEDRQKKIDSAYMSIMMSSYRRAFLPIDIWKQVEKLEKVYMLPKLRKIKLEQIKNK